MEEKYFTPEEKEMLAFEPTAAGPYCEIQERDDFKRIRHIISDGIKQNHYRRDRYGINPTIHNLNTAMLLCDKISPDRNMIIAILLFNLCKNRVHPHRGACQGMGR